MRLDLGCGPKARDGFVGVDLAPPAGGVRADLCRRWPFGDGVAAALHSSHLVEHLADLIGFMNEAYRVLRRGGTFQLSHPYQHSNRAWQDPTHVRALNEDSWPYYSADWRRANSLGSYPIRCDFEVAHVEFVMAVGVGVGLDGLEISRMVRHQVNVVDDLLVTLVAR